VTIKANFSESLLSEIASYYADKLAKHGETPMGVDWNGGDSQARRFEQLCKILPEGVEGFSLNDIGCGYGAMFDFLLSRYSISSYLGIDVSQDMIRAPESRFQGKSTARFISKSEPDAVADYGIASGIFNVRLGPTDLEWCDHLQATLDILDKTSIRGFAFNCLTSYSDEDKKRDYLYYADPCRLFDLCMTRYSRHVALLHDHELYEFTILVRKVL
jgi:SAM-dependent methyltransferase